MQRRFLLHVTAVETASGQSKERTMNHYESSTSRAAFSIAALSLSALTIALLIVAPVSRSHNAVTVVETKHTAPQVTEVVISPARVDVVATRAPLIVAVGSAPAK
jgi:hypothetical protein